MKTTPWLWRIALVVPLCGLLFWGYGRFAGDKGPEKSGPINLQASPSDNGGAAQLARTAGELSTALGEIARQNVLGAVALRPVELDEAAAQGAAEDTLQTWAELQAAHASVLALAACENKPSLDDKISCLQQLIASADSARDAVNVAESRVTFWSGVKLSLDNFFERSGDPIDLRLESAQRLLRDANEETKQNIRAEVERALRNVLIDKSLSEPLVKEVTGLLETVGVSKRIVNGTERRETKIILGIYELSNGGLYNYWPSNVFRQTKAPGTVCSTNAADSRASVVIEQAPRDPICIEAIELYNRKARSLRGKLADAEAWVEFAGFCEELDKRTARYRELARQFNNQGVYPPQYAPLYTDLSFQAEAQAAGIVVDYFSVVNEILNSRLP
jgi:hypothetical protein